MTPHSQSHLQPWNLLKQIRSVVFFVVFLLVVSPECIESGDIIKTLPGFVGDLPFTLETGYISVGEPIDVQYFYYFVESEGNPKNDPLILWLVGGPGCSALTALISQMGPLIFDNANSTSEKPMLEINPDRWTKVANVLFVDQPAGSGYAYAKTREAYLTNDTLSTTQVYYFLKKWLLDHPKFLNNSFYIGADSYNGILTPMILQKIYNGNEVGEELQINIKGFILGNPLTDERGDYNTRFQFAHRVALLSDAIYESVKKTCHGEYLNVDPNNDLCMRDLQVVEKCLRRINTYYILDPICEDLKALENSHLFMRGLKSLDKTSMNNWLLPRVQRPQCHEDNPLINTWANLKEVRKALHIHEEFDGIEWVRCNETLNFVYGQEAISYTYNVPSTVAYHKHLTNKSCRALIFSGDHDMAVSYLATLKWIESLNLSVVDDWRPWFVDEQVAGYTMKYSTHDYNLTFATVKGGGHIVRLFKPKEMSRLFMRWLANENL